MSLELLKEWQARLAECEAQIDRLNELTGMSPESPLCEAITALMGFATRTVAKAAGFDLDTLEAWWFEHGLGDSPMRAGIGNEPLRTIRTIEDLHAFLAELKR